MLRQATHQHANIGTQAINIAARLCAAQKDLSHSARDTGQL